MKVGDRVEINGATLPLKAEVSRLVRAVAEAPDQAARGLRQAELAQTQAELARVEAETAPLMRGG